jgi:hypothetical protein
MMKKNLQKLKLWVISLLYHFTSLKLLATESLSAAVSYGYEKKETKQKRLK